MLDLGAGGTTPQQVAAHDQPIRCARFVEVPGSAGPVLVTGSWDKTIKYWDLRQGTPVASINCQDRVYSMDAKAKLLVVACAERYLNIVNLDNPQQWYKTLQSPLKWQTRVVTCFTDATGFAIGSIEGRCAIQYVEEKDSRYLFLPYPLTHPSKPLSLTSWAAQTSPSNVTANHHQTPATHPTSTLLTQSLSTLNTAPSALVAATGRFISGIKMPSTVSRGIQRLGEILVLLASTKREASLRMQCHTIGVKVILPTRSNYLIKVDRHERLLFVKSSANLTEI